jgi:cation:H+ antiporter
MDFVALAWLVAGLVILTAGADLLVRGASRLAGAAKISPLVIGLTVVAFGTSAPELAVSVRSALAGQADIALGNVVGSNIFNVLVILGLAAVVTPLVVSVQIIRLDAPIMVAVSLLLVVLALDGTVSRIDGVVLAALFLCYVALAVVQGRKEATSSAAAEFRTEFGQPRGGASRLLVDVVLVAAGLGALVLGATWFVDAAVAMARAFGVSELMIGLTIVAAGTSLPELATSVVASIKGEREIAVGNVVGSNIFNILAVLGITAVIAPTGVAVAPAALTLDLPVMTAVAFACLPIFFTGHRIARWEGLVFLAYYAVYTTYLALAATQHASLATFGMVMAWFVLPLTVVTLVVTSYRAIRAGHLLR